MKEVANSKITRKELYDLVWSKPVSKILDQYSVSNDSFKKLCKENNIPLPVNGYWSKLRYNVPVDILKLPNPSDDYSISIDKDSFANLDSPLARINQLKRQLLKESELNFTVSDRLIKPDPLIVSAKKGMEQFQKRKYYLKGNIVSTMENQISISVAKNNISRALKFMDAFVKLIKSRGHFIKVEKTTKVIINNQVIEVRFRETMKREQHPEYSWITKIPSGILSFRIDTHKEKEWRDSVNKPLETRLIDILAKLELLSVEMEEYQIELERGWEEQRVRREIEEEIRNRKIKEISDFKSLINSSGRWHKSQSLRNYLDTFETKALENNTLDNNKKEWLKWARKKADWYDPFIESEDETFIDIDRDEF